jgi:cytochrome c551
MFRNLLLTALASALIVVAGACGGGTDGGTAPATTPVPTSTASAGGGTTSIDGAALYAQNCAGCHKADGSGGFGPDLRGETDVAEVTAHVRDGGSRMPAFGDKLTAAQIQALAEYVTSEL